MLTVNKEKCVRCGACVASCPIGIIKADDISRLPLLVAGAEKACINCGHCVAVCPKGAVSLESMKVDDCPVLRADWRPDPKMTEIFLKGRRSIRTYKSKPVAREIFEKVIDTARYAASGINRQPVSWAVVHDTEKVSRLAELTIEWMRQLIKAGSPLAESLRMARTVEGWEKGSDRICRKAPHLVVAYGLKDDPLAPQACTIALTYFELAAISFGLGTCWAGYVNMAINASDAARECAGLSKRAGAFGSMLIGYPQYEYSRIPLRNKARILWR